MFDLAFLFIFILSISDLSVCQQPKTNPYQYNPNFRQQIDFSRPASLKRPINLPGYTNLVDPVNVEKSSRIFSFGPFGRLIALINTIQTLEEKITELDNAPTFVLGCPSSAGSDSEVIGESCFSFETSEQNFTSSIDNCENAGGQLAEPSLGSSNDKLGKDLRKAFRSIKSGSANALYIGGEVSVEGVATFLSGKSISITDRRWGKNTITVGVQAAIVMSIQGNKWQIATEEDISKERPCLCQYERVMVEESKENSKEGSKEKTKEMNTREMMGTREDTAGSGFLNLFRLNRK